MDVGDVLVPKFLELAPLQFLHLRWIQPQLQTGNRPPLRLLRPLVRERRSPLCSRPQSQDFGWIQLQLDALILKRRVFP